MTKPILILALIALVVLVGCSTTLNDAVSGDAKQFCKGLGFGDWGFVEDDIRDGKFYCINDSYSDYLGNVEDYYTGVKNK